MFIMCREVSKKYIVVKFSGKTTTVPLLSEKQEKALFLDPFFFSTGPDSMRSLGVFFAIPKKPQPPFLSPPPVPRETFSQFTLFLQLPFSAQERERGKNNRGMKRTAAQSEKYRGKTALTVPRIFTVSSDERHA